MHGFHPILAPVRKLNFPLLQDDLDRMRKEFPALQETVTAYGKTMVDNMKMRLLSQLPAEEAR